MTSAEVRFLPEPEAALTFETDALPLVGADGESLVTVENAAGAMVRVL